MTARSSMNSRATAVWRVGVAALLLALWMPHCGHAAGFAADSPPGAAETAPAASQPGTPQAAPFGPEGSAPVDCRQLAAQLQEQKALITREAGQIKREIAALREQISEPGVREVVAGIGYILGLTGIGFYYLSRRSRKL